MEKNTVSKHTKGEWVTSHFMNESSIYCPSKKVGIAKMPYRTSNEEEVQANAAYIVKACNAHSELVNCLQAFVYQIETYNLKHEFPGAYMDAKNILKKVNENEKA